jgi:hypothetical protein
MRSNDNHCHAGLRSGIHSQGVTRYNWIPSFDGMTIKEVPARNCPECKKAR